VVTTLPTDDGPHELPVVSGLAGYLPAEPPAATVDGMLWLQFHTSVTLTPFELEVLLDAPRPASWGGTDDALTREVLRLLATERDCLTADDIRTMRLIVDRIKFLKAELERGDALARERLLALGHDPDKRER
jgi:hypothetical protein